MSEITAEVDPHFLSKSLHHYYHDNIIKHDERSNSTAEQVKPTPYRCDESDCLTNEKPFAQKQYHHHIKKEFFSKNDNCWDKKVKDYDNTSKRNSSINSKNIENYNRICEHENKAEIEKEEENDDASVDVPVQIPELDLSFVKDNHLFSRSKEIKKLHDCYHRTLSPFSKSEFIIVSGMSGTGKTSLVNKLKEPVSSNGGYFVLGKFDQLQKPRPYSGIVSAFTEFLRLLLKRGPGAVYKVRQSISKYDKSDKQLLVGIFPDLHKIIHVEQKYQRNNLPNAANNKNNGDVMSDHNNIMGAKVQSRFKIAVRKLFVAICSIDSPLLLAIDDLQWADSGSIDLLQYILSQKKIVGLSVVGICRSDEVNFDHALSATLRYLEDHKNVIISHIIVHNLSIKAANEMISHALHTPKQQCKPFAEILAAKTEGNVLFLLQLLETLYNNNTLFYDIKQKKWYWDEHKLLQENNMGVIALIAQRIEELPDGTQTVLTTAACLGAEFDQALLTEILSGIDVPYALRVVTDKGIIKYNKEQKTSRFTHDCMQQASYSLISEHEKAFVHISIGRRLWKRQLSMDINISTRIFLIVDQMIRGESLLEDENEKNELSMLCLFAGKEAIRSSDFQTASKYFWQGIKLLNRRNWRDQYRLSLELYSGVAEIEYCVSDFERMDIALNILLDNANSVIDKMRAYTTRMCALWARSQMEEAIDLGLFTLNLLGVNFPSKIGKFSIIAEILKTKCVLYNKSNTDLLQTRDMENPKMIAAMQVMNHLFAYAAYRRQTTLFPLLATRSVLLSMKYGFCEISALAFCVYPGILFMLGDFKNGYNYFELAMAILDRYDTAGTNAKWKAKVHSWYYTYASMMKDHIFVSIEHLFKAEKLGMETGDIESALNITRCYSYLSFFAGSSLSHITKYLKYQIDLMLKLSHRNCLKAAQIQLEMTKRLTVYSKKSIVLSSKKDLHGQLNICLAQHQLWRLILGYHLGDIDVALDAISKITPKMENWYKVSILNVLKYFYVGLVSLEIASQELTRKNLKFFHISIAKKAIQKIIVSANIYPKHCLNKVMLLQAELEAIAIEGNNNNKKDNFQESIALYDKSISIAETENFIHEQALACERAFLFCASKKGKEIQARAYLEHALELYKKWGATGKVVHIQQGHIAKNVVLTATNTITLGIK